MCDAYAICSWKNAEFILTNYHCKSVKVAL